MQKPTLNQLPTSQLMVLCQVLGLPQGGDSETKEVMLANLGAVPDEKWAAIEAPAIIGK